MGEHIPWQRGKVEMPIQLVQAGCRRSSDGLAGYNVQTHQSRRPAGHPQHQRTCQLLRPPATAMHLPDQLPMGCLWQSVRRPLCCMCASVQLQSPASEVLPSLGSDVLAVAAHACGACKPWSFVRKRTPAISRSPCTGEARQCWAAACRMHEHMLDVIDQAHVPLLNHESIIAHSSTTAPHYLAWPIPSLHDPPGSVQACCWA